MTHITIPITQPTTTPTTLEEEPSLSVCVPMDDFTVVVVVAVVVVVDINAKVVDWIDVALTYSTDIEMVDTIVEVVEITVDLLVADVVSW